MRSDISCLVAPCYVHAAFVQLHKVKVLFNLLFLHNVEAVRDSLRISIDAPAQEYALGNVAAFKQALEYAIVDDGVTVPEYAANVRSPINLSCHNAVFYFAP